MSRIRNTIITLGLWIFFIYSAAANAISLERIPSQADAARIFPEQNSTLHPVDNTIAINTTNISSSVTLPPNAQQIHFILHKVHIRGMTVFTPKQLETLFQPYLNQDITLVTLYELAAQLTLRYRNRGYFLSRAYIPEQEISNGEVFIHVVEGYIGEIEMQPDQFQHPVIKAYIQMLLREKPLRIEKLESVLLRLGDLPGIKIKAVLSALPHSTEGAVKITLITQKSSGMGQLSINNYNSGFIGPEAGIFSFSKSIWPLQETSFATMSSLPFHKLSAFEVSHKLVFKPKWNAMFNLSRTQTHPGLSLDELNIESTSSIISAGIEYQVLRQRFENLSIRIAMDVRNSDSTILDLPLTRDRIRALRTSIYYATQDPWSGVNNVQLKISQGITGFGASRSHSSFLSRAQGRPDFTKFEIALARQQRVLKHGALRLSFSAQASRTPLLSAEQFGYGGVIFGRAFDNSEITGDQGVSGGVQLAYIDLPVIQNTTLIPYTFYDFGKVWNKDPLQIKSDSAASVGFGLQLACTSGLQGQFGLAWPLHHRIATPLYGQNDHQARVYVQLMQWL